MAKHGNESRELLLKIRQEKIKGSVVKRFEDEFFALDLLKILYDDSEESAVKTELLILLEEYGHLGLKAESIDQFVTSLLDIVHQAVDNVANWMFVCQALITSTSLLIQLQQLSSEICGQLINELVSIVTSRVNQPDSQRVRSCACQCLTQMEELQPGLLNGHLDEFLQLTRQERTQVFQDYALLSSIVMQNAVSMGDASPVSPGLIKTNSTKYCSKERNEANSMPSASKLSDEPELSRGISIDPGDLRQMTSLMLENISLFTSCGSLRIIQSLVELAKTQDEISPMMFKSLMLHQMATMSCVLFHSVLYIQRQFPCEILTASEEYDLVDRLCLMADHPCLNMLHKLLACQWVKTFQKNDLGELVPHECVLQRHRLRFYPSVFDPVDTQLSKLYITSFCSNTDQDTDGIETSILLGSLGCLHKLVWHTGSGRAAVALFKALYFMYTLHNSHAFATDIQRFVRGLISEFPHFIPNSMDFIDSIQALNIDNEIYVETLGLLHQQVATATKEQIYNSYQFYLQILKKVAIETSIDQSSTLKLLYFLTENAAEIDDSSWKLGHDLLEICRNLMTFHGTRQYYISQKDSLISLDVDERERKLSSQILYNLENFFVINPNRTSIIYNTDDTADSPQEIAHHNVEIKRQQSLDRSSCSLQSRTSEDRLLLSEVVTPKAIEKANQADETEDKRDRLSDNENIRMDHEEDINETTSLFEEGLVSSEAVTTQKVKSLIGETEDYRDNLNNKKNISLDQEDDVSETTALFKETEYQAQINSQQHIENLVLHIPLKDCISGNNINSEVLSNSADILKTSESCSGNSIDSEVLINSAELLKTSESCFGNSIDSEVLNNSTELLKTSESMLLPEPVQVVAEVYDIDSVETDNSVLENNNKCGVNGPNEHDKGLLKDHQNGNNQSCELIKANLSEDFKGLKSDFKLVNGMGCIKNREIDISYPDKCGYKKDHDIQKSSTQDRNEDHYINEVPNEVRKEEYLINYASSQVGEEKHLINDVSDITSEVGEKDILINTISNISSQVEEEEILINNVSNISNVSKEVGEENHFINQSPYETQRLLHSYCIPVIRFDALGDSLDCTSEGDGAEIVTNKTPDSHTEKFLCESQPSNYDIEESVEIECSVDIGSDDDEADNVFCEAADDSINSTVYNDIAMSLIGLTIYEPDEKDKTSRYKRRLEKTVKDVVWFSFCFIVCMIPRLVLDIFTVACKGSEGIDKIAMHTLVVSSETGLSIMLFVFNATFLWRYKVYQDE